MIPNQGPGCKEGMWDVGAGTVARASLSRRLGSRRPAGHGDRLAAQDRVQLLAGRRGGEPEGTGSHSSSAFSNFSAAELMQYRWPVGSGPSSKTWPRCPWQRPQCTSVRTEKRLRSDRVPTFFPETGR